MPNPDLNIFSQTAWLLVYVVSKSTEINPIHHLAQPQVDHHPDDPRHLPGPLHTPLLLFHPRIHRQEYARSLNILYNCKELSPTYRYIILVMRINSISYFGSFIRYKYPQDIKTNRILKKTYLTCVTWPVGYHENTVYVCTSCTCLHSTLLTAFHLHTPTGHWYLVNMCAKCVQHPKCHKTVL